MPASGMFSRRTMLGILATAPVRQGWAQGSRQFIPAFGRPDSILKSWRGRDSFLTYRIDSGVGDGQGG